MNVALEYTILFPFEEDPRVAGLAFEIEHGHECFRTVGLVGIPYSESSSYQNESDEERDLRLLMRKMVVKEGDYDVADSYNDIGRASTWIISFAALGDNKSMEKFIDKSPNPTSLLGITTEDGKSLLGLAAPNGHLEAVNYLLGRGCDVNVADDKGRTPLMEAALWGQVRVVDALLKAGANNHLTDREDMTAANLAEDSDKNDYERHTRGLNYKEDPYIKKKHRLLIRCLLGDTQSAVPNPRGPTLARQHGVFDDAHFFKSQSAETISLVLPALGIKIPTQHKTAAVLLRGDPFPPVVAVSGWTGLGYNGGEYLTLEAGGLIRLNEGYWALESINVARDMGGLFREDVRDRKGVPGSYNACHAEAQLISFFVRRNYLFRDYIEEEEQPETHVNDEFLQLFLLQPRNRTAEILVSNKPCASCLRYASFIHERIGIEFSFRQLTVKV